MTLDYEGDEVYDTWESWEGLSWVSGWMVDETFSSLKGSYTYIGSSSFVYFADSFTFLIWSNSALRAWILT